MVIRTLHRFFENHGIEKCKIVAAVSSGADSTALLAALAELDRFDITAAHVNHHLRGEESDGDERFVRELCARLGIELDVADGTLDPDAVKRSGIEAAARDVRTRLLLDIRRRRGAAFIATAHQKNDQAETIVMRVFTGSGIAGLRGIHPVRDDGFIRPLLEVTRAEIEAFLAERGITPRIDSSNADPRFLRNRVRAMLRDFNESVIDNIAGVGEQAWTMWQSVERALDAVDVDVTESETRFLELPSDVAQRQALLHRHIRRLDPQARDVSAKDLTRLANDLDALTRTTVTKSLELVRRGAIVVLRRIPQPVADYDFPIEPGQALHIPQIDRTITIHPAATSQPRNPATQPFQLPPGATPRFHIRNRRDGDRFRPLGLHVEKKLKELLIDRKIPAEDRDRIPLLVWNDEIVWVAGVEISEAFKISEAPGDRYEATVVQSPRP